MIKFKVIQDPWAGQMADKWMKDHPQFDILEVNVTPAEASSTVWFYPIVTIKYEDNSEDDK